MVQPMASIASAAKSTSLSPRGLIRIYIMYGCILCISLPTCLAVANPDTASIMKHIFVFLSILYMCSAAPAPAPAPVPVPAPAPKADPGLLYATPLITAPAAVSYSTVYKAPPSYSVYTPYVYNLGYASAYPYSIHPYYII